MTKGLEGWNLEIARWRELEALMPTSAWTTLLFHPTSWNRVPDAPGVYMVTGGPPLFRAGPHSAFSKPLYIGESEASIRTRFRAHTGDHCQRSVRVLRTLYDEAKYPTLHFHFLQVGAALAAQLETLLIECYGPPANRYRGLTIKPGVPAG